VLNIFLSFSYNLANPSIASCSFFYSLPVTTAVIPPAIKPTAAPIIVPITGTEEPIVAPASIAPPVAARAPAAPPATVAIPVFAASMAVIFEPVSRLNLTRLASFSASLALILASAAALCFADTSDNYAAFAAFSSASLILIKPSSIV
jgi:hypothetical protein